MLTLKPALSSLNPRRVPSSRQARTHIVKGTRASIALPNQHGIWLDSAESAFDVLYGQNFVVQRPKRGGPGLVLSPKISAVQILKDDDVLDVTEYSYVEKARLELPPPRFPLTQETGVVLHSSSLESSSSSSEIYSSSPRRTAKVQFTCKRCGETSVKPINPHAWENGSVFARCDGCKVVHKLTDNLKIFHELTDVFPGIDPSALVLPAGIPKFPGDFHVGIGGM